MARLRVEYKIFLATFFLSFVALIIIHQFALPFYWANASSQQGRPIDLYLPSVWTPAIIFYSVLIAVVAVVICGLFSWVRKDMADAVLIFITAFCLGGIGFWLFLIFLGLRWGHTLRLPSYGQGPNEYGLALATFFVSFVSAVFSTVVFEFYKLIRSTKK